MTKGIENVDERIRVLGDLEAALTDEHLERGFDRLRTDADQVRRGVRTMKWCVAMVTLSAVNG